MTHLADLHNFGQQVKKLARASGSFYQKPRTLFWEWLLFGHNSPMKNALAQPNGSPLSELFALEVEFGGPNYSGQVREVLETPVPSASLSQRADQFGALLAYCYALGIRDLHRFNLLQTSTGLQVIDAEVVFTKLLLPHETLLMPFKDVAFGELGMSCLVPSSSLLTVDASIGLLRGYTGAIQTLGRQAPDLLSCVQGELLRAREAIPVRHIIRDTHRYRDWQKRQHEEAYLPEEILQLERGDIPYFFKFIGKPELWFYGASHADPRPVAVPARYEDAVRRDASRPGELLNEARILGELLPVGLLI